MQTERQADIPTDRRTGRQKKVLSNNQTNSGTYSKPSKRQRTEIANEKHTRNVTHTDRQRNRVTQTGRHACMHAGRDSQNARYAGGYMYIEERQETVDSGQLL